MIRVTMSNKAKYEVRNESWGTHGLSGEYRLLPKGPWYGNGLFCTKKGAELLHDTKTPTFYILSFAQLKD